MAEEIVKQESEFAQGRSLETSLKLVVIRLAHGLPLTTQVHHASL